MPLHETIQKSGWQPPVHCFAVVLGSQRAASWAKTTRLGSKARSWSIHIGGSDSGGAWPSAAARAASPSADHDDGAVLGGGLLLDRSDDAEEPLRVYADPDGHPFCVFVAPPA